MNNRVKVKPKHSSAGELSSGWFYFVKIISTFVGLF